MVLGYYTDPINNPTILPSLFLPSKSSASDLCIHPELEHEDYRGPPGTAKYSIRLTRVDGDEVNSGVVAPGSGLIRESGDLLLSTKFLIRS